MFHIVDRVEFIAVQYIEMVAAQGLEIPIPVGPIIWILGTAGLILVVFALPYILAFSLLIIQAIFSIVLMFVGILISGFNRIAVLFGWRREPPTIETDLIDAICDLVAFVINADGKIKQAELINAISIGRKMIPNFSESKLRKKVKLGCSEEKFLISALKLKKLLEREQLEVLLKYFIAIVLSDNELHDHEAKTIGVIAEKWQIDLEM